MTEYGANHPAYSSLNSNLKYFEDQIINSALQQQLEKSVDYLDLPVWLIDSLKSLSINKIRDVLGATEETIQKAYYVGKVRSRYIKNEASSAVFEYLSG
jgi:DNA-directed RNA polymerase alpha subunit